MIWWDQGCEEAEERLEGWRYRGGGREDGTTDTEVGGDRPMWRYVMGTAADSINPEMPVRIRRTGSWYEVDEMDRRREVSPAERASNCDVRV